MPRQRQPPSLRKACKTNIVCHFEDFWCAGSTSDLLQYSEQSDVFTPFQYLSDDIIQELIHMLRNRNWLYPYHFKLLLHSNIRHLDLMLVYLSGYSAVDHEDSIIKTLGIRCQKLTHLRLFALKAFKPEILCTLVRRLPHLVSVSLKNTRLDDNVIKTISENCPDLLELDLTGCIFDDKSLLYLCNFPEHTKPRPKLRKLVVGARCNLSTDTVVHLLKNQKGLQCLACGLIDSAFIRMYGEGLPSSKQVSAERVHNLLDIVITGVDYGGFDLGEADRLYLTFQCCPYLTKLHLVNLREDESLDNLVKLKHLKILTVSMLLTVDYSTHMAPLLNKIGDNLTYLKCYRFDKVSLILIGKSCRNLESLELHYVSLISEQHPVDGDVTHSFPCFTNLKVIRIHLDDDYFHPPTDIDANVFCLLLLNATKLVEFSFDSVINMTDNVISEANRKHGFKCLVKGMFEECSSISMESLWVLLSTDNPLEHLSVHNCKNITRQNIKLVRQEAKLRQFNITIDFN